MIGNANDSCRPFRDIWISTDPCHCASSRQPLATHHRVTKPVGDVSRTHLAALEEQAVTISLVTFQFDGTENATVIISGNEQNLARRFSIVDKAALIIIVIVVVSVLFTNPIPFHNLWRRIRRTKECCDHIFTSLFELFIIGVQGEIEFPVDIALFQVWQNSGCPTPSWQSFLLVRNTGNVVDLPAHWQLSGGRLVILQSKSDLPNVIRALGATS